LVGALAANGVIWEQTVENAGQELEKSWEKEMAQLSYERNPLCLLGI